MDDASKNPRSIARGQATGTSVSCQFFSKPFTIEPWRQNHEFAWQKSSPVSKEKVPGLEYLLPSYD